MPSFDIVSEVDMPEVNNALDQARREVGTRFDFKGVDATFEIKDKEITLTAESDFQLEQMLDILKGKMVKRNVEDRRLAFTTDLQEAVEGSDVVFICVGTPPLPVAHAVGEHDAAVDEHGGNDEVEGPVERGGDALEHRSADRVLGVQRVLDDLGSGAILHFGNQSGRRRYG